MRPISQSIRKQFKQEKCYCCPNISNERHHALIYQGRQVDEAYAIIPLCIHCHRGNNGTIFKDVKLQCEQKAIMDGLEHLKMNYSRFNWEQRLKYLNQILLYAR